MEGNSMTRKETPRRVPNPWSAPLVFFGIMVAMAGAVMLGMANNLHFQDEFFEESNRHKRTAGSVLLPLGLVTMTIGVCLCCQTRKPLSHMTQPMVSGYNPPAPVGGYTAQGGAHPAPQQPYPQAGAACHGGYPQATPTHPGGNPPPVRTPGGQPNSATEGQPSPAPQQPCPQSESLYHSEYPHGPPTQPWGYPPAGSTYPPPNCGYTPPPSTYGPQPDAPPPPPYDPPPPSYAPPPDYVPPSGGGSLRGPPPSM